MPSRKKSSKKKVSLQPQTSRTTPLLGGGEEGRGVCQSVCQSVGPLCSPRDPLEGLRRFPGICGGVADDFRRRYSNCGADYMTAFRYPGKTLSAALFIFFATLFSTVALGVLIETQTDHRIGVSEYLAINSLAGMLHALFGAQPLLVLRPTGPITAIVQKLSQLADSFNLDFFEFIAATGCFISLYMIGGASVEVSRYIRKLTPFTHDIFACFVCSIYVHDGVSQAVGRFGPDIPAADSLWSLLLSLIVFSGSLILTFAPTWNNFSKQIRQLLADYAVTISVIIATGLSYAYPNNRVHVERIHLPSTFSPTCYRLKTVQSETFTERCFAHDADISKGGGYLEPRPWITWENGVASDHLKLWVAAALAAIPITFFFYMDQNISSLLCQLPSQRLSRGSYFNVSFGAMGIFNVVGPIFGTPFVTGSLPHSPQMVRALSHEKGVAENRIAPLLTYMLLGIPLFLPAMLRPIPKACIDGVLAYVGMEGILTTDLFHRFLHLLTSSKEFPEALCGIKPSRVRLYTLVQLAALAICWIINLSPAGLLVSIFIIALVPFRRYVMPSIFTTKELMVLDPNHEDKGRRKSLVTPVSTVYRMATGRMDESEIGDPIEVEVLDEQVVLNDQVYTATLPKSPVQPNNWTLGRRAQWQRPTELILRPTARRRPSSV